jgi:hypothetical protein
VRSFEEYAAANEVQWEAFGAPAEQVAENRGLLRERWSARTPILMHVTWLAGEIVCAGECAPTPLGLLLFRGATLPRARGRGAYQALIHARWRDTVASGMPALITQAGAMSRPILERLGFRAVGHVHVLLDEFSERSPQ